MSTGAASSRALVRGAVRTFTVSCCGLLIAMGILRFGPATLSSKSEASFPNSYFCGRRGPVDGPFFGGACYVPTAMAWSTAVAVMIATGVLALALSRLQRHAPTTL